VNDVHLTVYNIKIILMTIIIEYWQYDLKMWLESGGQQYSDTSPFSIPWWKFQDDTQMNNMNFKILPKGLCLPNLRCIMIKWYK